jgi:hypothetical protein
MLNEGLFNRDERVAELHNARNGFKQFERTNTTGKKSYIIDIQLEIKFRTDFLDYIKTPLSFEIAKPLNL